jgi:radical SAM PhpK family P-methyltransferase
MNKTIDCFFIGHNEMEFVQYEKSVRRMGINSGAYQDLNKNFIHYNGQPYTVSEIFNLFSHESRNDGVKPISQGENFNAAIAYLGSYLHRRELTFDFVNSFQDEKEQLVEKLAQENILTIAIVTTLYISVFPILEIINFIKKYNKSAKIIIGGPFVFNQVRAMDKMELNYLFTNIGADFYVYSTQGETALVEIIHTLKNNSPGDEIKNIYYKDQNKQEYRANPVVKENNLLSGNMVNWDLFSHQVGEYVNIRTSISCPFACSFCGFPLHAGKYRTAGVEEIEKELDCLENIGTVKSIQFIDDTFNVPVNRFKDILRMMIRNKYTFRWHSHFRCQFADEEMVELMKESHCEGVFLGIESANEQILKNMNKAANVDKYLQGIALLNKYEILTYGSFIIGFPGETEDSIRDSIEFITNSGLDFYRVQLWYCDPVTPIWQERQTYNIEGSHFEWRHNTMDSKTANQWINHIFQSIDHPIWLPQYNFEFDGIFHLLHREIPLGQVKEFIKNFNNGVKSKIIEPHQNEIDFEIITQLKKSFQENNEELPLILNQSIVDNYEADFDF